MPVTRFWLFKNVVFAVAVVGQLFSWVAVVSGEDRRLTSAEMPRVPYVEAGDAIGAFRTAAGFSVELVAAEPLVSDPVDACFDEYGRMFVAEMHGYPFSFESTKLNPDGGGKQDAGIIRFLEDTDGDGRMDSSVVFADGISWPTSVCCYDGGVFVIAPGNLYYFKDTDGDNKADIKDVVLTGFGRDNVQAVTNGLQWGPDNRIYFSAGRNPKQLLHRGKPLPRVGASDLCFDPRTENFEIVTGGAQFGHTRDDWGTRFVCSNSDHIMQVIYPQEYLARNPFLAPSGLVKSIATDGASGPVFRISPPEPWRIVRQKWRAQEKGYRLQVNQVGGWEFVPVDPSKKAGVVPTEYPEGFFTSATGITIYRGNAYPEQFRGNAFVGDVGGNLVHRKTVNSESITYTASRADSEVEILASTDNWFRPVNFLNAPDGSLYILDMYRETIEHPYSIPGEIKAFLDLSSGADRGRIYRLVSPNMRRNSVVKLGSLNHNELVQQLASGNGWNRDTAQRLIWERNDPEYVPLVEDVLERTTLPQGKVHALAVLAALNALTSDHVKFALSDPHPRVRAHGVRLAAPLLRNSSTLLPDIVALVHDESEHVRFELAFSLGESDSVDAVRALADLARDADNGAEIKTAILSSVGKTGAVLAQQLIQEKTSLEQPHVQQTLTQLGVMIGSNPDFASSISLLGNLNDSVPLNIRGKILASLCNGLARRGASLETLLETADVSDETRIVVVDLFQRAASVAGDESLPDERRQVGVELLSFAEYTTAAPELLSLLSSRTSQALQKSAVQAMNVQADQQVAADLLRNWRSYSPVVRGEVIDALLADSSRVLQLLIALENGEVQRADIDITRRTQLTKHRLAKIRDRAQALLGADVETNRSTVVDGFQDVLSLSGDAVSGREVFVKTCSACHKVGDFGHQVAPDLASVKNKSSADLLIAILDPNREGQPNYNTYTIVTRDGRNYSGIVATETANSITLRRAEAKEDVVLRSNIDEMVASGISLMPVGLEKELSRQQIADVIAFVKSIGQLE